MWQGNGTGSVEHAMLCKAGRLTMFDVRITDTDAPTYRNRDPVKVLAAHEKEKKDKYLEDWRFSSWWWR